MFYANESHSSSGSLLCLVSFTQHQASWHVVVLHGFSLLYHIPGHEDLILYSFNSDTHLYCFPILILMNLSAINILVHIDHGYQCIQVCISAGTQPRVQWLSDRGTQHKFRVSRAGAVFQSGCTNLLSPQLL